MPENFYAILTNTGKAKIANAMLLNQKVDFNELALGDGGGIYANPTENQTALVNEIFRCPIGAVTIDTNNSNWIVVETAIAAQTGGFMIREAGIYDSEGDLLAVAKYPETYKPALEEGSVKDLLIRMILEVTNASVVTLKVDPTVILATKKDLERYSLLTHNHDDLYYKEDEIDSLLDEKVDRDGDTMTGRLNFDNANGGIQSANNQSRNFLAGGSALSIYNGSYITTEGVDFGGVGQGGNINFALPADKGLVLGVANVGSQVRVLMSSASPEGVKTAEAGSLCIRVDTGKIYVKQSGSGNVGWKELSVSETPTNNVASSGFASGWGGQIQYRKNQEGLVLIHVNLTKSSDITAASTETLFTLPAGFRPATTHTKAVHLVNSGSALMKELISLSVDSQGIVKMTAPAGQTYTGARTVFSAALVYYAM